MSHLSKKVLCLLVIFNVYLINAQSSFFEVSSPWVWKCEDNKCLRKKASDTIDGKSYPVCKLTCYESAILWPKPTGPTTLSKSTVALSARNVNFTKLAGNTIKTEDMLNEAANIFLGYVKQMETNGLGDSAQECSAKTCSFPYNAVDQLLKIEVYVTESLAPLSLTTDESYTLSVETKSSLTTAYITAKTYFGARHAMETLSQLITWDELSNTLVMITDAHIEDAPVFPHRGFAIDTARNYMEVSLLKRIIDGLSYNKLNVLHWHITDSNSFPFVSPREPLMAIYGAHSARQVYQPSDIQDLVHYAQVRGVKIIPELDAPSHVGAGWDWGPLYGMGELALCFDIQPWDEYCAQPPCGVLNPINDNMYKVMRNIFSDMADLFQSDVFHMGGDEVNTRCWNETGNIVQWMEDQGWGQDHDSFLKFWSYFQNTSLRMLDEAFKKEQPIILWSSDLTKHADKYLDRNRYVIQFWENWNDTYTKTLYEQGYKLIMSNSDALYLDCGYGSWVGNKLTNWCPPYISWKKIYNNSPRAIIENFGLPYNKDQFWGGEAALWAEQSKGLAIEGKIWPRLSALAERLWTDPETKWLAAEPRLNAQTERMFDRGLAPDPLQPEYCLQHDGSCFLDNPPEF